MVDIERQFICKVIAEGDLKPVLECHIGVDQLADLEHRRILDLILEHWSRYGKVPSRSIVRKNYPNYRWVQAPETYQYYLDELLRSHQHRVMISGLNEVIAVVKEGPAAIKEAATALAVVTNAVNAVAVDTVPDAEIVGTHADRLERYRQRADRPDGLLGLSTGFSTIDKATLGLQPEQFVIVIGPPAAGKSTLLLKLAVNVLELPARVLFIGFETARADAMIAQVSHRRLITGTFTRSEERSWGQRFAELVAAKSRLVMVGDRSGVLTVSSVAAKIEQHQPALVVIDGLYLMTDEFGERPGSPQALTNITRNTKRMAQRFRVPILASTQALHNKMTKIGGVSMDSIGYSSSFAQDADVILGVQADPNDSRTPDTVSWIM
jgi:replicative DNA helicase